MRHQYVRSSQKGGFADHNDNHPNCSRQHFDDYDFHPRIPTAGELGSDHNHLGRGQDRSGAASGKWKRLDSSGSGGLGASRRELPLWARRNLGTSRSCVHSRLDHTSGDEQ